MGKLEDILVTKLKIIPIKEGNVMRGYRSSELLGQACTEVYFSKINPGAVKAWKLHKYMTMRLIVISGNIGFVFYDRKSKNFRIEKIGVDNYCLLTIPPEIIFGFKGISVTESILVNCSDIEHDPDEIERFDIGEFRYNWGSL